MFQSFASHFPIDQLPDHILVDIFGHFKPPVICEILLRICRRWRRLAYTSKSPWHTIKFNVKDAKRNESFGLLLSKVDADCNRDIIVCTDVRCSSCTAYCHRLLREDTTASYDCFRTYLLVYADDGHNSRHIQRYYSMYFQLSSYLRHMQR